MENTCVLTVLPVVPKWKIYNPVTKKQIKYCSILKEKREFENLLENVTLPKRLKKSCSIIDKKIGSSKGKHLLEIVFLNLEEKDLLSLNLIISKKDLTRRRNNLIIFLKNNACNLKYQDDSIYVKCNVNVQWHIFYNLFEFLLVRYGICNIGAVFYCVLFSGVMLKQEINFIYYIQVDLKKSLKPQLDMDDKHFNNATTKPLKRTLCSQNCFNDSFVLTNSQDLTLKKICYDSEAQSRITISPQQKIPKFDCICSEMNCKCHESKWQIHRKISKYNVSSYMDILLKKGVASTDELSIAQGDSVLNSTISNLTNHHFESSFTNILEKTGPSLDLPLRESQNGAKCSQNSGAQMGNYLRKATPKPKNASLRGKLLPKPASLLKAINLLNEEMSENPPLLLELPERRMNCSTTMACNISNSPFGKKDEFEEFAQMKMLPTNAYNMFQTAAGKNVAISDKALKAVEKMFTNVMEDGENVNKSANMFQTASGKNVNISDKALKAAEKMFTEVMESDEDGENVNKSANNIPLRTQFAEKSFPSSSSHSKLVRDDKLNENIDEMLVDNFFEDICFDEKDEGSTGATQSYSMLANKCDNSSSIGKVRKSLGGRRSLRPYSIPKS